MSQKVIKKLYRSTSDRMFAGVCGGIATYFVADSTIVRLLAVLVICFTGFLPGLIAYIVCTIIIPTEPVITQPHK